MLYIPNEGIKKECPWHDHPTMQCMTFNKCKLYSCATLHLSVMKQKMMNDENGIYSLQIKPSSVYYTESSK